jgi:hypothetical protein
MGSTDTNISGYVATQPLVLQTVVKRARAPIVTLLAIVIVVAAVKKFKKRKKSGFYTPFAEEEPTRPYTPYTGTEPVGEWGARPWAEVFDPSTNYRPTLEEVL